MTGPYRGRIRAAEVACLAGRENGLGLPAVGAEGLRVGDAEVHTRRHERRHSDAGGDVIRLGDPGVVLLFGLSLTLGLHRRRGLDRCLGLHRGGRGCLRHASSQVLCRPGVSGARVMPRAATGCAERQTRSWLPPIYRVAHAFWVFRRGAAPRSRLPEHGLPDRRSQIAAIRSRLLGRGYQTAAIPLQCAGKRRWQGGPARPRRLRRVRRTPRSGAP
jgi:hypothetical protein